MFTYFSESDPKAAMLEISMMRIITGQPIGNSSSTTNKIPKVVDFANNPFMNSILFSYIRHQLLVYHRQLSSRFRYFSRSLNYQRLVGFLETEFLFIVGMYIQRKLKKSQEKADRWT